MWPGCISRGNGLILSSLRRRIRAALGAEPCCCEICLFFVGFRPFSTVFPNCTARTAKARCTLHASPSACKGRGTNKFHGARFFKCFFLSIFFSRKFRIFRSFFFSFSPAFSCSCSSAPRTPVPDFACRIPDFACVPLSVSLHQAARLPLSLDTHSFPRLKPILRGMKKVP
jgi:hypothetical protein